MVHWSDRRMACKSAEMMDFPLVVDSVDSREPSMDMPLVALSVLPKVECLVDVAVDK
jgi:hypothetical protein